MGWRGGRSWVRTHKKKLTLRKIHLFVIDKHVEDFKQDQKIGPDLEMGLPTDPSQFSKRPTLFRDIWPRWGANISKNAGFKRLQALLTLILQQQLVVKCASATTALSLLRHQ